MIIKFLQFIAVLCSGLLLGLTLTHILQAPGSAALDGSEWLTVQHTFYGGFAIVGGVCEIAGLIATGSLGVVSVMRGRMRASLVPFIAAASFAGTLLAFVFGNAPVNAMVAKATAATLPSNWEAYRATWEAAHAVSAALAAVAFLALVISLVWRRDTATSWANTGRAASASRTV